MTEARHPMSRRVVAVPPAMPLASAWKIMTKDRIRHLPVVQGGKLVGILSDRDVRLYATEVDGRVEPPAVPVGEVMSPAPHVCFATTPVADIVRTMTENKIDALPVVDPQSDRLVGVVTSTDLMLLLVELDEAKAPLPFQFELEEHRASLPAS